MSISFIIDLSHPYIPGKILLNILIIPVFHYDTFSVKFDNIVWIRGMQFKLT